MNTIELPVGNNVVPLRSETIHLVQNGCSFHGLRSEDPKQHLKDFLKLVDSLDLDSKNNERTRLCLFQFSFRDQASNWIERLPAGSITTWEDLTTRFLAQFFPPGRTTKLRNDILMFQQHHKESCLEAWTQDLALYDNESWNDLRDFAKPVKAITLPQDVLSTSDRRLIDLENQVQRLMEAHLAPTLLTQVNKITTLCEICSGPHDTQYCMEDPEQAFVEYASSRTDEAGAEEPQCSTHIHGSINAITIHPKQQSDSHDDEPAESEEGEKDSPENTNTNPFASPDPSVSKGDDGDVMFIEIVKKGDDSRKDEPEAGALHVHVEKAYIDLNSPLNVMTRMMYNWIMRRKLDPRENSDGGISNFTGRIKGMHVFVGNFTYVTDFMIVEDISSIIDPRISQVVLGKPFVEISNMTHDPPKGVVRFIDGTDEIAYKMPHRIEQYISLSDLEREHTKSVYLRNDEDRRRGVEYVMSKILGFYKECLELGPEYVTGMDDEGEVTLYLIRRSLEVLRKFHWMILGGRFNQLSHVSSPLLSKPGKVVALEWHLEEIHVTWPNLEKKQTRLRTYTKSLKDLCTQRVETALQA
ncbi:MAK10-like protein [Tanacetum coccineum]